MVWYNPFSWFTQDNNFQEEISKIGESENGTFYCASPQCRKPLGASEMAYETKSGELVHLGNCQQILIGHRVLQSDGFEIGNFDILTQEQARKLATQGKINPTCLDDKLN